ncbi:MAG: acyltransferase family protein [Ruminococcus sp.]|nr:acyltransferase family protein [Ruminococcus sp.]
MKKRIGELDFIKGIAIILVVLGHIVSQVWSQDPAVYEKSPLFLFCYSFHMPLFVFISGYVCSVTIKDDINWLAKRLKRIGLPYFLALILWYIILRRESISTFFSPMAYWYLPFVMIADTAFFFDRKTPKGCVFSAILIISALICKFEPFHIDIAHHLVRFIPFYFMGTVSPSLMQKYKSKLIYIYSVLTLIFIVTVPFYRQGLDAQLNSLPWLTNGDSVNTLVKVVILFINKFIVPIAGIGAVMLLTRLMYSTKCTFIVRNAVEFIGKQTLFIYLLHDLFFVHFFNRNIINCVISLFTATLIPILLSVLFTRINTILSQKRK